MEAPKTRKDTLSLNLVKILLEQLQSKEDLDTIARQLVALVSPLQGQSKVELCTQISRLIFELYSSNPGKDSTELYTGLCHSLLASKRHAPVAGTSNQIAVVHNKLFDLCVNSIAPVSPPEIIVPGKPTLLASDGGLDLAAGCTKVTKLSIESISHLVSKLFEYGLISVAQVYQCTCEITKLSPTQYAKDGLLGLCTLLETDGYGLNTPIWAAEIEQLLEWGKKITAELNADDHVVQRMEGIAANLKGSSYSKLVVNTQYRELSISPSGSCLDESDLAENNYGSHPLETLVELSLSPHSPSTQAQQSKYQVLELLQKLKVGDFDRGLEKIIEHVNNAEHENDGETLRQVIEVIFEKAKDEAAFSEMYARLCRKMMERISLNVRDEKIRSSDGQPIAGGMLLRRYLLNRCQEDFERGWSAKEAALASKAGEDKAASATSAENSGAALYSDEYYAAIEVKRRGLGLVRFIGELFKWRMLTERIIHACIQKLLSNVVNPEEEEIESLCELLTTVGQSLDTPKAKNYMDIYFERMQGMAKDNNINSRMQSVLQDVIELRARQWQPGPTFTFLRQNSNYSDSGLPDGTQRGTYRGASATEPDGQPPMRAGDLSAFAKISKPNGIPFGPSSVFGKKDENKRD
ncbi:ARM repeat-containing protein [Rhizoctonia solani]|uniref:ARM repeat-containing protein n=2 Tax=Rhizoctonia solani TaxID=456999 RepID=A0A8H7H6J7_9AGAM|nr:ARM repeat-containing protein [Rhizoctonia solani]